MDPRVYIHTSPDLILRAAQKGGFYGAFFTFEDSEALQGAGNLPRATKPISSQVTFTPRSVLAERCAVYHNRH